MNCFKLSISQHVSVPTHNLVGILDLFICDDCLRDCDLSVLDIDLSGHSFITFISSIISTQTYFYSKILLQFSYTLTLSLLKAVLLRLLVPIVHHQLLCYRLTKQQNSITVQLWLSLMSLPQAEPKDLKSDLRMLGSTMTASPQSASLVFVNRDTSNQQAQLTELTQPLHLKKATFLRMQTKLDTGNPRKIWNSINRVVGHTKGPILSNHTASDFVRFFTNNVEKIRSSTESSPLPRYAIFTSPELNVLAPTYLRSGDFEIHICCAWQAIIKRSAPYLASNESGSWTRTIHHYQTLQSFMCLISHSICFQGCSGHPTA